jgi:hypothetical protein
MMAKYEQLVRENPQAAASLLPAIAVAAKTAVGASAAGLAGAGVGFVSGVGLEVLSALQNAAYGEHIANLMQKASVKIADLLQKIDSTLSRQEAQNIVAGMLLTASTYKYFKSEVLDATKLHKSLQAKPEDFTLAKNDVVLYKSGHGAKPSLSEPQEQKVAIKPEVRIVEERKTPSKTTSKCCPNSASCD